MHLYVLVAAPVRGPADEPGPVQTIASVGCYGSWIQAAFLVGWALGGGFFGRVGDRLGRSRTLMPDDSHLCPIHRPVVLRPDVVAIADLPLHGGVGNRRRVGSGGVAALGNLAEKLAAVDGGRAATGGQPRRDHRGAGRAGVGGSCRPHAVSRRHCTGAVGALDSPPSAGNRGVARGEANGRQTSRACWSCFAARTSGERRC